MSWITKLEVRDFSEMFCQPLHTSWGTLEARSGCYLLAETKLGFKGIAELSPLEGFSQESLAESRKSLSLITNELLEFSLELTLENISTFLSGLEDNMLPSLRWALETLFLDIAAKSHDLSISEFLQQSSSKQVEVNGLLSGQVENLAKSVKEKFESGFKVCKLKILPAIFEEQVKTLKKISSSYPQMQFRLDCNQGLSIEQTYRLFDCIDRIPIEYIEEPLINPSPDKLYQIKKSTNIKIALDESLENQNMRNELLKPELCDVAVIKPMLLGGYTASLEIFEQLRRDSITFVATSTLETVVGLLAGLHLAAVLASRAKEKAKACGFDTIGLYKKNFLENRLVASNGIIKLPKQTGLGLDNVQITNLLQDL